MNAVKNKEVHTRKIAVDTSKHTLRLRFNETLKVWEIYTHLSGSNLQTWKWFIITKSEAEWYRSDLNVRVVPYDPSDCPNPPIKEVHSDIRK